MLEYKGLEIHPWECATHKKYTCHINLPDNYSIIFDSPMESINTFDSNAAYIWVKSNVDEFIETSITPKIVNIQLNGMHFTRGYAYFCRIADKLVFPTQENLPYYLYPEFYGNDFSNIFFNIKSQSDIENWYSADEENNTSYSCTYVKNLQISGKYLGHDFIVDFSKNRDYALIMVNDSSKEHIADEIATAMNIYASKKIALELNSK